MRHGRTRACRRPSRWQSHPKLHSVAVVVCLLAAVALVTWEGQLSRSSLAARASVGAVIAVAVVVAVGWGRRRQRERSAAWAAHARRALSSALSASGTRPSAARIAGTAVWVALVAATVGWDLNSFVHEVPWLPTLSRLFGDVTRFAWGRATVFAGWLSLGGYLALGWRRPIGDSPTVQRPDRGRRQRCVGP